MSISILNRGISGGTSSGLKPELTVTAPVGSTIDILQNGIIVSTYTLGAEETEHTFVVRVGTYTVRGILGANTTIKEVVIDIVGQYKVEIIYPLWLYREGDECQNVTGGFVAQGMAIDSGGGLEGTPSLAKLDTYMRLSNPQMAAGVVITSKLIDITKYNKLIFRGSSTDEYKNEALYRKMLVILKKNATYYRDNPYAYGLSNGVTDLEINISKISGSYHIGFGVYKNTINVSELRLEKIG